MGSKLGPFINVGNRVASDLAVEAMERKKAAAVTLAPTAAKQRSGKPNAASPATANRSVSRRDRKIALQRDVDKLRRKLRHEENVHRALERAFTRPLGALPRLPPYLPSHTLELLAEVALLEEEVFRLEEQIVSYRHGIDHRNASASPKQTRDKNMLDHHEGSHRPSKRSIASKQLGKKNQTSPTSRNSHACKENNHQQHQIPEEPKNHKAMTNKMSPGCSSGPNKLSEDILHCLLSIYRQMSNINGDLDDDPYRILGSAKKDIGSYRQCLQVDTCSFHANLLPGTHQLAQKLNGLLKELQSVDLAALSHQQKLAFWINVYNSCMMNAYLDHGIPTSPHSLVTLMLKATLNVGGQMVSAMTIENFILRSSYCAKDALPEEMRSDDTRMRQIFSLQCPEPLVTFALSCGTWSSPAVRVYTAAQVEEELETAKREYLQAAITISGPSNIAIPKLLHYHLLDFAKDVDSFMDWICLQLPTEMQHDAARLIQMSRNDGSLVSIRILPFDFQFRYLLAV